MYMGVLSAAWTHSAQGDQKVSAYGTAALDVKHHVVLRAEPGTSANYQATFPALSLDSCA